ncbi:phenylacetaldehyde reductase-like [Primulina huaijiensis]|uniref:phenylacetaldehyde reductase-like n=1 Tax=Primulina huaijiensis TaxID=1492673 RepID=UPI003CC749E2
MEPAVNGTLNFLKSCAKTPSNKRVVVTSFIASVTQWYWLAKTLVKQTAVRYAEQNGIGPLLQPTLNASSHCLELLFDVRDVVFAHVMAFEYPSANGRYILVEAMISLCIFYMRKLGLHPQSS